jgi:hypothetical protein
MKKLTLTLIFGLLFAGFTVSLQAQAQTTVNATASAELVEALTASEITQLNFGRFVPGSTAGTIKIASTSDGTRTKEDGVLLVGGGSPGSAEFTISGYANETVNVSLPADGAVDLTHGTSGEILNVATFTASTKNPALNASGEATIYVGGSLTIKSASENLTKGLYTGTYTVTFQYP